MPFIDNKQHICDLLLTTLQATRAHNNLISLDYLKKGNSDESVTAVYDNNHKVVINVSCDSGIAMIHDILNTID